MHEQPSKAALKDDEEEGDDPVIEKEQRLRGNDEKPQKLLIRNASETEETPGRSGSGRDHSGTSEKPRKV